MNNGVVGITILALCAIFVIAIVTGNLNVRQPVQEFSFPKNSYTDAIGNVIDVYGKPQLDLKDQLSKMPFTQNQVENPPEPEMVQTTQVLTNATSGTQTTQIVESQITIGISKATYSGLSKVVTTADDGSGVSKVKRGEIAVMIGQIKLLDPVTPTDVSGKPNYINGPFSYHVKITCCAGELFIYANRPTLTDNNGMFVINYPTTQSNILGTYSITVETETATGSPLKFTQGFLLVE